MSETKKLKILRAWDETPTLRRFVVAAGDAKAAHTTPGQYLQVQLDAETKGFFSMANAPHEPDFELLVKKEGKAGTAMAALEEGALIESKPPSGKGYPLNDYQGRDLLFFAQGSGIAPIRAAVRHIIKHRADFGNVTVYYGQRAEGDFAFRDEWQEWEKGNVIVVPVLSRPGDDWAGARGRVQDAFAGQPPTCTNPASFACGTKDMVKGVSEALKKAGFDDQVLQNF